MDRSASFEDGVETLQLYHVGEVLGDIHIGEGDSCLHQGDKLGFDEFIGSEVLVSLYLVVAFEQLDEVLHEVFME